MNLSLADKVRTESAGIWLGDDIINAAQGLLQSQFPEIAGFRASTNFSMATLGSKWEAQQIWASLDRLRDEEIALTPGFKEHLAKARFRQIQILFVNGNHWIVASNHHKGSVEDVYIYDSLPPDYDSYFKHQVASVFRLSSNQINLIWPPMYQQPNSNDCGGYAIANAVALAFGEAPEAQNLTNSVRFTHADHHSEIARRTG